MIIWQVYIRAVEIKGRKMWLEAGWYRFLQNPDLGWQTKLFCWFKLDLKSCSFIESISVVLKVILILGCDTCFSLSHQSSYFREELNDLSLSMGKISMVFLSYSPRFHVYCSFRNLITVNLVIYMCLYLFPRKKK